MKVTTISGCLEDIDNISFPSIYLKQKYKAMLGAYRNQLNKSEKERQIINATCYKNGEIVATVGNYYIVKDEYYDIVFFDNEQYKKLPHSYQCIEGALLAIVIHMNKLNQQIYSIYKLLDISLPVS